MNIIVRDIENNQYDLFHTYVDAADHIGMSPRRLSRILQKGEVWYFGYYIVIPREHKCQAKVRSGI